MYGVPRYKEINPGIFTIVSFSYQFGVMFGDIGHGGLLLIFGIYLLRNHLRLHNTSLQFIIQYRYFIFMIGFFSFYCGLIYNEFFSIPIRLFPSCYDYNDDFKLIYRGCVYPFGIDTNILISPQELLIMNSFKMKLSIIIGVIQMTFGIILKGVNSIYNRSVIDFLFDFLP